MNRIQHLFASLNDLCTVVYALIGARIAFSHFRNKRDIRGRFLTVLLYFFYVFPGAVLASSFGGVTRDTIVVFQRPVIFDNWKTIVTYAFLMCFLLLVLAKYKKEKVLDSWPCWFLINFLDGEGLSLFAASSEELVAELNYAPALVVVCACITANGGGIWAKLLTGKQKFRRVIIDNLWYYGITLFTAIQYYTLRFEMGVDGNTAAVTLGTLSGSFVCVFAGLLGTNAGEMTRTIKKNLSVRIGLLQTFAALFRSIIDPHKGIRYTVIVFRNATGPHGESLVSLQGAL